jgi:SAM-dependent methyltransferase
MLALETGLDIQVRQEWGERLPFSDGSFDLVFGRAVLHHARNLRHLCAEARRVLRLGGTFIAVREHVISNRGDLQRFLDAHPLHRHYGGENAYLLSEYTEAIKESGIRLTKVINPCESNINLYPDTVEELTARFAAKLRLASPQLVPSYVPALWGAIIQTPGRLFSFVGEAST